MIAASREIRIPPRKVDQVIATVAACRGVEISAITGPGKDRRVSEARLIAYWIARRVGAGSFPYLAKAFRRHHTTVLSGCRRVELSSGLRSRALEILPAAAVAAGVCVPEISSTASIAKDHQR